VSPLQIPYFHSIWKEMSSTGRKTLPWDLIRSALDGCVETTFRAFFMIVAIHYFDCSVIQKSLVASATAVGLILSLVYSSVSGVWFHRRTVQTFVPYVGIAVGACLAALAQDGSQFVLGVLLFGMSHSARFPSLTALYRDNYRGAVRGQVLGITTTILVICGLLVTFLGGKYLDIHLEHYRVLFLLFALAALIAGGAVLQMPSGTVQSRRLEPVGAYLRVLKEHPVFAYMLAYWFIFGLGNLAMEPQMFEMLSQEQYGFCLTPGQIAFLIGLVPEIARLLSLQAWAWIFDRLHIITVRILINACFLAYTILYFQASNLESVMLALILRGIGLAGGSITWSLWVTKFASPEDTARYMALHTFLTGIRGSLGPYIGYLVVGTLSLHTAGWIATGFIFFSTLMVVPLLKRDMQKKV